MTPTMTANFILKLLKKESSFVALYQVGSKPKGWVQPGM